MRKTLYRIQFYVNFFIVLSKRNILPFLCRLSICGQTASHAKNVQMRWAQIVYRSYMHLLKLKSFLQSLRVFVYVL